MRPGKPELPIVYEVDRIRDGRSFTTRRVVAIQAGEAILNMSISFHQDEVGLEHQIDAEIPAEVEGELYEDGLRRGLRSLGYDIPDDAPSPQPVEIRVPEGLRLIDEERYEPRMGSWMRARGEVPPDPALHQCLLAYGSDLIVMVPAIHPHDVGLMSPGIQSASLDHAMWFHRPVSLNDWVWCAHESPASAGARGFGRIGFYSRSGQRVASCAQEGLIRSDAATTNLRMTGRKQD